MSMTDLENHNTMNLRVKCRILCHSHTIPEDLFSVFDGEEYCYMHMRRIDESRFDFSIKTTDLDPQSDVVTQGNKGSYALARFMMGLNIASLGLFDWDLKFQHPPYFVITNDQDEPIAHVATNVHSDSFSFYEPKLVLATGSLVRATQIMRAMIHEPEDHVFTEYMKGIYHFGLRVYGFTFRKEAFANFYRSLEYFVTNRILNVRRLDNEVRRFHEAFERIGLPDSIKQMFREETYPLICAQVMHAQGRQKEILWEDVAKLKMVCDATMQQVYKPIWEAEG